MTESQSEETYGLSVDHLAILRIRELELRIRELEVNKESVGSHHGDPILTRRDIALLESHLLWVKTARESSPSEYDRGWLPHDPDWIKSRLFWRIRSGKEPLKYPPPRAWACPWYELIEVPGPHDVFDGIREYDLGDGEVKVSVAQCSYDIISKDGDIWNLAFGKYCFKAWNGTNTYKRLIGEKLTDFEDTCGWIEYVGEAESIDSGNKVV